MRIERGPEMVDGECNGISPESVHPTAKPEAGHTDFPGLHSSHYQTRQEKAVFIVSQNIAYRLVQRDDGTYRVYWHRTSTNGTGFLIRFADQTSQWIPLDYKWEKPERPGHILGAIRAGIVRCWVYATALSDRIKSIPHNDSERKA